MSNKWGAVQRRDTKQIERGEIECTQKRITSEERSQVVDPELRDLLPLITEEEREALTAGILKNGCYSPMICMEDMTLVDGHHRYDICTEHDIPYPMVILDFEDKKPYRTMIQTVKAMNLVMWSIDAKVGQAD